MKRQWRIFGNYKLHWNHLAVTHYLHRLRFFGRLTGSILLLPFCPCLVSLQTLPSTQWVQLKKKGRRGGGDGRQGKEGREKARSRWKRSERRNWVSSLKFLNEQWQGEGSFPVGGPWGGEWGCSSAQAVETYQEHTMARPVLTITYLENEMQESYTTGITGLKGSKFLFWVHRAKKNHRYNKYLFSSLIYFLLIWKKTQSKLHDTVFFWSFLLYIFDNLIGFCLYLWCKYWYSLWSSLGFHFFSFAIFLWLLDHPTAVDSSISDIQLFTPTSNPSEL